MKYASAKTCQFLAVYRTVLFCMLENRSQKVCKLQFVFRRGTAYCLCYLYPDGDRLFPVGKHSDLKLFVNLQLLLGEVACSWTSTETEIAVSWHADEHTVCKIALAMLQLPLWSINLSLLILSPLSVTKWRYLPPSLHVFSFTTYTWSSPVDQHPELPWKPTQGERAPHWQVRASYWHWV